MNRMKNTGLVLEGGGMRGLYTSGVLDYFMEKGSITLTYRIIWFLLLQDVRTSAGKIDSSGNGL